VARKTGEEEQGEAVVQQEVEEKTKIEGEGEVEAA